MQHEDWRSFIFKSPEVAKEWLPKLEAMRAKITPGDTEQSVDKLILMDYDRAFALDPEPHVVVAGCETTEGDEITLEDAKKQMFQMSDGGLNSVATCSCGYLRGNYNLNSVCPKCNTKVRSAFADEVNFGGWLVIPDDFPPFLHPVAYRVLRKWMGKIFKSSNNLLDGLLDPDVELPEPYASTLGQGMEYFYNNFEDVINFVAKQRKDGKEVIAEFLQAYKYCMFVRHIPILNQSLHIITQSGTMSYNDKSSDHILTTWLELSNTIYAKRHSPDMTQTKVNQRYWSIYSAWMRYIEAIIDPRLSGKTGFIRKNLLGDRMHASCRAVIAPITRIHDADDIELPWRMAVGVYKLECMNILTNRFGKSVNEACTLFNDAIVRYNPIIDSCLTILLEECPFKGFPMLMGRNPTLQHGAIQLFLCTKYKKDPCDNTVGMTPFAITCPNADYD